MKKATIFAVMVLLLAGGAMLFSSRNSESDMSFMLIQNAEALAQDESGGGWVRTDGDCVYSFEGKAGGKVEVKIAGVTVATLTIGADGKATYTYGSGKTNCASDGNEQCTARYCPELG